MRNHLPASSLKCSAKGLRRSMILFFFSCMFSCISVFAAPAFITQPVASQTVCAGVSVSFSVTASGTALTYQWRKNGVNITGATSATYTISAVVAGSAGTYTCRITDGTSIISNNSVLNVNATPAAPTVTTPVTYCQNSTAVPLTASGTSLAWDVNAISGSVGGTTYMSGSNYVDAYVSNNRTTLFTTTKANVTITSVDCYTDDWQTTTNLQLGIFNSAGTLLVASSTVTSAPSVSTGFKITNVFNYTITAAGTYSIRVVAGFGNLGGDNPTFPVTETTGTVRITGATTGASNGLRCFNNIKFTTNGSSSAPTPATTSVGTTNYPVSQTVGGCESPNATIAVVVSAAPTAAAAGADQTGTATCGITTVTLAANAPTVGTGAWSIVSGTGGSFANTASRTSTFTGTAGSTYILRWTISTSCSSSTDDMRVMFNRAPTTANAGPDQTGASTCGLTMVTLAANTPTDGTGAWSIVSGTGGTVATPSSATSTFSGIAGSTYTLRWTISNSCSSSTNDVVITFNRAPTTAVAGPDQTGAATCGLTTVTLAGNTPSVGTGAWSIVSGTGGTVTAPSSAASTFSGTAGTTYTLRWTISNGICTASTDDVLVTFNRAPSTSNAGADQTGTATCGLTTLTLAGNTPTVGTGTWSIVSGAGGTVANPASATSTFSGTAGTTYNLRWTIYNSPCNASINDLIVTFNRAATTAVAGPDQTGASTCGSTSVTLAGNAPSVGTGTWSIVAGSGGTITAPSSATSTFTGTAGSSYTLRWSVANSCSSSTDDMQVTFNRAPTTAAAGPDQTGAATCGLTTVTLAGNTPTVGTGAWSIVSGTGGTITTPSSATSTFSGTAGTTYTLRWSISNGSCTVSTNDVIIGFTSSPSATIGYAGSPFFPDEGTAAVTRTGSAGGTYSAAAGLSLNATTGAVTLASSTVGTYLVTYTVPASGSCPVYTTTTRISIINRVKTWDGGAGTNNWGDANNWNSDGVPGASDDVLLDGANTININVAAVANNLTIENPGLTLTVNAGNSLAVSGDLLMTSGTLNTANAFPSVGGSVALNGGTVGFTGSLAQTIPAHNYNNLTSSSIGSRILANTGSIGISGTFTPGTNTYVTTGSTINYDGVAQTVAAFNYNNLAISNSGTKVSSGNISVGANLTINASTVLDMSTYVLGGTVLNINGTGTLKTQCTTIPAIPVDATWMGTVEYNSSTGSQRIVGGTYTNLTNSNTSGSNHARGIISVSGILTLNNLSVLNMGISALGGSPASVTGTGSLTTQNTSTAPIPPGKTWPGSVTYDNSTGGQTVVAGVYTNFYNENLSGANIAGGNITVNNTFALEASSILDLGNYVLNGALSNISGSGTLKTQNNSAAPIPAGKTWSGTVEYNYSAGGQTIVAGTYTKLTNSNTSGTNTAGGSIAVVNTLTLNTSSLLYLGANALSGALTTVTGSGTLKTGNTSGSPVPSGKSWTGTVEYSTATGGQTIASGIYHNLKLGNTSGTHSVNGDVTIGGTLTFAGGTVTTGANTVYLTSTGTISRTSGHVVGNFRKNIATGATSKTFEIGDAANYTPVTVVFGSVTTAGDLTASTSIGDHDSIGTSQFPIDKTVNRTWRLSNNGIAFTSYDATFAFVPGDVDAGVNTSTLLAANYSNDSWVYPTVGTRTATSTQAIGLTTFDEFQIGFFMRYHYKTKASGNWTQMNTWSYSTDGGLTWANAPSGPGLASDSVLILTGHAVTGVQDIIPALLTVNGTFTPNAGITMTGGILNGSGTVYVTRILAPADFNSQYNAITRDVTNLTVNYNVLGAQTVNNLPYKNLILSGSGVKTLPNSAMTIIKDFTTSGTISTSAATSLTIGGNVTLGAGTSINLGSTTHDIAGNWTNNGATITAGTSTVNFNGSLAQTLGGLAASSGFRNLTISNTLHEVRVNTNTNVSGILNMNGATTVLTPAATVVFNSAGATGSLIGNGTVQVTRILSAADYAGQYKFLTNTLTNLTVDYAGAGAQVVNLLTYGSLKASGTGTKTVSGNIVVNGVLTIEPGVTLNMGTNALTGTLTSTTGNGTLATQNTSATPLPLSKTWSFAVNYNSSLAQHIVPGNYTNLSGAGGDRTLSSVAPIGIAGTFTPGAGNYTTTGSTVDFNGAAAQTIPSFVFDGLKVSGGSTKSIGGSVTIKDVLDISANTTLSLGENNVTLQSDSYSTARVTTIPTTAAITYGTGRFVVQRFIQGRRKYRLIASSVTTSPNATLAPGQEAQSIWGNWQNKGINTVANAGTFITGGKSEDGFDRQTTNASMFTYNDVTKTFVALSSTNGKNTKYTPLTAGVAYYMFVYGDRLNSITTSTPNPTVLSATGTLATGPQVYNTTSPVRVSATLGNFSLIGNPYACTIDWKKVQKSGISSTIWGWDAGLNSTGGYVTVTATAAGAIVSPISTLVNINRYVQAGQGFFVKTTSANPQLIINEDNKVQERENVNNNIYRENEADAQPLMAYNLLYTSAGKPVLADGAVSAFDPSFAMEVNDEDGMKMVNSAESISILNGASSLSIDARPAPKANDTIFLNIAKMTRSAYTLEIFANNMGSSDLQPYLEDAYLQTSQQLSLTDTNRIVFKLVSTAAASKAANRFRIVFRQNNILPVTFTTIKAAAKNSDNLVEWNVATEEGIKKYEVERSSNGTSFQKVGEVKSRGNSLASSYSWLDVNVTGASNYYRIRAVEADGQFFFSKVVVVKSGVQNAQVKVFPNPVRNNEVNLQFTSAEKGMYTVVLHNQNGQTVLTYNINHPGGSSNEAIPVKKRLPAGFYRLRVIGKKNEYSQNIIVE